MSDERRTQLQRRCGSRLRKAFRGLLKTHEPGTIDVVMFWPPDHDAIHFLASVDRKETSWDFDIPTKQWTVAGDPDDRWPSDLLMDVRHLFRSVWKDVAASSNDTRAYLRLHEDDTGIDLKNGRQVADRDRPDHIEPDRIPFTRTGESTRNRSRDGERFRLGDTLAQVQRACGVDAPPDEKRRGVTQYYWPDRGMRIEFEKDRVALVVYFAPFAQKIGGAWIGAHAWEIHDRLGPANREFMTSRGRIWHYDVDGTLVVSFDRKDRVSSIGR